MLVSQLATLFLAPPLFVSGIFYANLFRFLRDYFLVLSAFFLFVALWKMDKNKFLILLPIGGCNLYISYMVFYIILYTCIWYTVISVRIIQLEEICK